MTFVAESWEPGEYPQHYVLRGSRTVLAGAFVDGADNPPGPAGTTREFPIAIYLQPRPSYCDRGRWYGIVDGPLGIDAADCFPRYYMDEERAKAELREWLVHRLNRLEKS